MSDPRLPRARAFMSPNKPVEYEIIPAEIQTITESDVSKNFCYLSNNHHSPSNLRTFPINQFHMENMGVLSQRVPFKFEDSSFNLEKRGNANLGLPVLKSILMRLLESISPDTLEMLMMLLMQFLISNNISKHSSQSPVKDPDSPFREAFELIIETLKKQSPPVIKCNSKFLDSTMIVWKQILEFEKDDFQKVELTKSLQKKLTAGEIDIAIQQLIDEGGVVERVEPVHPKKSNGRAPSPYYRLLWKNPKYQKMLQC